jgi:hypothetical protein
LLELDVRSLRKSHKSLKENENNLKTTKAWTMCLKNENIKKQNETLKALNGSEIEFFF